MPGMGRGTRMERLTAAARLDSDTKRKSDRRRAMMEADAILARSQAANQRATPPASLNPEGQDLATLMPSGPQRTGLMETGILESGAPPGVTAGASDLGRRQQRMGAQAYNPAEAGARAAMMGRASEANRNPWKQADAAARAVVLPPGQGDQTASMTPQAQGEVMQGIAGQGLRQRILADRLNAQARGALGGTPAVEPVAPQTTVSAPAGQRTLGGDMVPPALAQGIPGPQGVPPSVTDIHLPQGAGGMTMPGGHYIGTGNLTGGMDRATEARMLGHRMGVAAGNPMNLPATPEDVARMRSDVMEAQQRGPQAVAATQTAQAGADLPTIQAQSAAQMQKFIQTLSPDQMFQMISGMSGQDRDIADLAMADMLDRAGNKQMADQVRMAIAARMSGMAVQPGQEGYLSAAIAWLKKYFLGMGTSPTLVPKQ